MTIGYIGGRYIASRVDTSALQCNKRLEHIWTLAAAQADQARQRTLELLWQVPDDSPQSCQLPPCQLILAASRACCTDTTAVDSLRSAEQLSKADGPARSCVTYRRGSAGSGRHAELWGGWKREALEPVHSVDRRFF